MRANELRIGNYYDEYGSVKEVTPNTILELFESDRKWISPIPLTEEWLIKFGFKKVNGYGYKFKFGYISTSDKYWMYHGIVIKIEYVHQLQNLYFALTGEELTIHQSIISLCLGKNNSERETSFKPNTEYCRLTASYSPSSLLLEKETGNFGLNKSNRLS